MPIMDIYDLLTKMGWGFDLIDARHMKCMLLDLGFKSMDDVPQYAFDGLIGVLRKCKRYNPSNYYGVKND